MFNLPTTSSLLTFIQTQGYFILLILMVVEGPIITAVAAFAASMGIFDIYSVFLLSILGSLIGDSFYYFIGRIGREQLIENYFYKFKIKKEMIEKIEMRLKNNPGKALAIIKIVPPLPTPGLILAGLINMPLKTFLLFSLIISFFYSLFFTLIGFYAGIALTNIIQYSRYVEIIATISIIIVIIFIFLYIKYSKRLFAKL